jgi:hypothetical protein
MLVSNLDNKTAEKLAAAMLTLAAALNRQVENPKPHTDQDSQITQKDFDHFLGRVEQS